MLDAFQRWIGPLAESLRFADLLDVAVVAAFLFALLTWFQKDARRGASRRLMAVLVISVALYLLASAFSMYLVKQLLEILLVVFLVAMVVIFQSEIRRMLDRIGSWSFARHSGPTRADALLDDLTESAAQLAATHTGALIALRGSETWDSQLHGGVELDGHVSLPLLDSIFHEKTEGHDGAVLLEEGRVTKFGVHLPLSSQMPPSSEYGGTRHAAALGLAEQTDALVIVVSEERGAISVAEEGRIEAMETPSDLKTRLRQFWATHHDQDSAARPRWWSRRSVQTAALALALACIAWLVFAYRPGTTYRSFVVPIEYRNVGERWSLSGPDVTEARVGLTGSERALRVLSPAELTASFNMEQLHPGRNELVLTEENLNLPSDVELSQAEPRTFYVNARRLEAQRLPVKITTTGSVPDSLRLANVSANPSSVEVLVPSDDSEAPNRITTEELDLSSVRSSRTATLKLVPPEGARLPADAPTEVEARLDVQLRAPNGGASP